MHPQLAKDAVLDTLAYPVGVMPKIDGVRALNINGTLTGRSLDPFAGYGITEYFSKPDFQYLDGEMILGNDPANPDRLCSLTTGAMGAFKGVTEMADLHWYCFDWLKNPALSYQERYAQLAEVVCKLNHPRIHLVPLYVAEDREELDALIERFFAEGYEGAIIRNLFAPAKEGRPGKRLQELVRVKGWADAEMLVTGVTEGEANHNEAKVNSLGRTERSSAKDGKVPNGMVGSIQGTLLADFLHPFTGKIMFAKGLPVTVSKGNMTHEEAKHYFENQSGIVGHIVKFKHLAHGTKTLPRMGQYLSHRLPQDM